MELTELVVATPDPVRDELYTRAGELIAMSGRVPEIVDDEQLARAADLDRILAVQEKKIDEHRKSITRKIDEAKKAVMDTFRPTLERLASAREQVKGRMAPYMLAKQRAEAERQRIAREAAERVRLEEAARLEAEAAKLREAQRIDAEVRAAEAAKAREEGRAREAAALEEQARLGAQRAEAEAAELSAQAEATLDQAVAPIAERKMAPTRGALGGVSSLKLVVDSEKIQAAIDFGIREIPGVSIYQVWTFEVVEPKAVPDSYRKPQVSTK